MSRSRLRRMIAAFALAMIAGRWASQWTLVAFGPVRVLLVSAAGSVLLSGWDVYSSQARPGCDFDHGRRLVHGRHFSYSVGIGGNVFSIAGGNCNQSGDNRGLAGCDRDSSRCRIRGQPQRCGSGCSGPVGSAFLMLISPLLLSCGPLRSADPAFPCEFTTGFVS